MKTQNMNPWPIIRWMAAAVFYLLTVLIAVDQVRIREAKLDIIREGLADLSNMYAGIKKEIDKVQKTMEAQAKAENQEAIREFEDLQKRIESLKPGDLPAR